jgi:hypothetical protein
MSWLTEGPLSRVGGDSSAARGARMGAAAGPVGLALGALGGWIYGRVQQGRLQAMSGNSAAAMADRQANRTDWGLGDSPLAQFDSFGHGEPTRDDGNIGSEIGITDWGDASPDNDSTGDSKPRGKLKESRENGSGSFALQGVSNFMVGGTPVINGSHGYGAFGGSGQGYFKSRRPLG